MEFSTLKKVFSQDYFAVPDYQRDYEWTNAQNSTLIDDIIALIGTNDEQKHFIGAIVTIPFEENSAANICLQIKDFKISKSNVKHIVDGQQRLTSISVLLKVLMDSVDEDVEVEQKDKEKIKDKLKQILYGNDYNYNDERAPKLFLNGNTGKYYNSEILGITEQQSKKSFKGAKRLKGAYDLFKNEIQDRKKSLIEQNMCINANDYYLNVCNAITQQIVLVDIECDKSSNAFQVFDSLNGKGLDLTAADRIKNIMLSWAPPGKGIEKWDTFAEAIGEEYLANFFVSDFFRTEKKRISKNKLPDEFVKKFGESAKINFYNFYNDIYKKAELYGNLRNSKTKDNMTNEMIKDLVQLKSEQSFVLIYSIAQKYDENYLKTNEYHGFLKALTTLIVRMQICEKSTNKLDNIFSKSIEVMDSSNSLETVTKYIYQKVKENVPDDTFKDGFVKYTTSDNKVAEFYLRNLETYERKNRNDRNPVNRGLTVEHIIPQGVDLNSWYGDEDIPQEIREDHKELVCWKLGNMALLYGDDNSSASNNNYLKKLDVYKHGTIKNKNGTPQETFYLIKELIEDFPDKFDYKDVEERGKKFANYALQIWKIEN